MKTKRAIFWPLFISFLLVSCGGSGGNNNARGPGNNQGQGRNNNHNENWSRFRRQVFDANQFAAVDGAASFSRARTNYQGPNCSGSWFRTCLGGRGFRNHGSETIPFPERTAHHNKLKGIVSSLGTHGTFTVNEWGDGDKIISATLVKYSGRQDEQRRPYVLFNEYDFDFAVPLEVNPVREKVWIDSREYNTYTRTY